MPDQERKKFKAVTEEVGLVSAPSQPVAVPSQEIMKAEEKHIEEVTKIVENKGVPIVPETNNIVASQKVSSKKNVLFFILIMFLVAFIVMALAGGIYVYLNGVKNLPSSSSEVTLPTNLPVATPMATPLASPSATAKPDYSLFNVSVLNGSGAIGAATAVRNIIQKGGFKVSYTGNADNFNYTDTIIQVKSTVSADVVAVLKDLLTPTYTVKIGSALDTQSRYDIVVSVGSK